MSGRALAPGDDGWDAARAAWNLAFDRAPALVAEPASVEDVIAVVGFARTHGLRVAPQTTGHNAGALAPLDGAVLVTTGGLQGVAVDAAAATARVGAGTVWGQVAAAADPHGLFPLAGSSPGVGVVGYSLGGGLGFLGRLHGVAANHVTAVEVVTPDGRLRRVTADDEPDLFWALRGAAGNFGVVTALEFRLFPHGHVTAGMFTWPAERTAEVLEAWHAWTATAPDAVTTSFRVMHFPPVDEMPPFLSGRSLAVVDGVFAGPDADAERALAPLRTLAPEVDTWGPCSPAALDDLHLDPPAPVPGVTTSMLVDDLDGDALARFVAAVPRGGPLLFGELRHMGGALAHAPEGAGAVGSLPGRYGMSAVAVGTPADPAIRPALDALDEAVRPASTGRVAPTLAERPTDPAQLWTPEALARLRRVRAQVDPDGLMLACHEVPQ